MATTNDLETLAAELSVALPPPDSIAARYNIVPGSGRWVVARVGSGLFALRAEFDNFVGGTVTVKQEGEIVGFPDTVAMSMRFTLAMATAGRFQWVAL